MAQGGEVMEWTERIGNVLIGAAFGVMLMQEHWVIAGLVLAGWYFLAIYISVLED